jgi:hypothetical protein
MKRPFEVTFIGFLFIVIGVVSSVFHLWSGPLDRWTVPIAAVGIIAIIGGIFLLWGCNWARWLLLAWLAVHVVLSAFNSASQTLAHLVLFAVIGYFLVWSPAAKYFQAVRLG